MVQGLGCDYVTLSGFSGFLIASILYTVIPSGLNICFRFVFLQYCHPFGVKSFVQRAFSIILTSLWDFE